MAKKDLRNQVTVARAFSQSITGATPVNTNLVDLQNYESATLAVATGTVTTAGVITFRLQESDSTLGSSFTDVAASDLIGNPADLTVNADNQDDVMRGTLGYIGTRRYLRAVITGNASTSGAAVLGLWVLGHADVNPPPAVAANIAAT